LDPIWHPLGYFWTPFGTRPPNESTMSWKKRQQRFPENIRSDRITIE
jgi:hypothetical protein